MKKVIIWCILLGALPVVWAIDLIPNEEFVFTYVNASNESVNETFFCPLEIVNVSVCEDVFNVSTSVSPGSSMTVNESGVCVGTISCGSCSGEDTGLCDIDRSLVPGRSYEFTDGLCNVQLEVDACDEVSGSDTHLLDYTVEVEVERRRNVLFINLGDDQRTYPVDENDFLYNFELDFLCPNTIQVDEVEDESAVLEACKQLLPLVLEKQQQTILECSDAQKSFVDRIETFSNSAADVNGDLVSCERSLSDVRSELSRCSDEGVIKDSEIARLSADLGVQKGITSVFVILTILLGLTAGWLWYSNYYQGGDY